MTVLLPSFFFRSSSVFASLQNEEKAEEEQSHDEIITQLYRSLDIMPISPVSSIALYF